MRRYNIVSGILLIISIIDFALAAPVLVQEKSQSCVDVVHIPKDVITALEKRAPGSEELEKLLEEYFNNMEKPVESSDAHTSSSSGAAGPDHWSTNRVQAPAPNPASSTANPGPLVEPSGPSLTAPTQAGAHVPQPNSDKRPWIDHPDFDRNFWTNLEDSPPPGSAPPKRPKYEDHVFQPNPGPSNPGYSNPWLPDKYFEKWQPPILDTSDLRAYSKPRLPEEYFEAWKPPIFDSSDVHVSSISVLPGADHGSTNVVQTPGPNPASSSANQDPLMEPSSPSLTSTALMQGYDDLHERLQTLLTKYRSDRELTGAHAPQPNPNKGPLTDPDPAEFDWNYGTNWEDSPPPGLVPPPKWPNPGPSTDSHFDWEYWMNLEDPRPLEPASPNEIGQTHEKQVEHAQKPNTRPSSGPDPELHTDPQSSSAESQPGDLLAAIYAAKGKAKESRRVSSSTRDIGNAAQREFQPV